MTVPTRTSMTTLAAVLLLLGAPRDASAADEAQRADLAGPAATPAAAAASPEAASPGAAPSETASPAPAADAAAPSAPSPDATAPAPAPPRPTTPPPPAFTVPPPAAPRIAWYEPKDERAADARLPWNSSIFGAFDPWTSDKLTILVQRHGLDLTMPEAEGAATYDVGTGGDGEKRTYPESRFEATYTGVRLEWGNWSIAWAMADGTIGWTPPAGRRLETTARTHEVMIARSFGAWAILDHGGADVRLGLSWPEVYLRAVYGSFEPRWDGFQEAEVAIVGMGVSLLGIRLTVGDLLFAELRGGDLAVHSQLMFVKPGGGLDDDAVAQQRAGFAFRPMLRVGLAL